MQQVTIKSIYINDTKQDGTQFLNKRGEPYKMAVLETVNGNKASMYIGMFKGSWDKKLDIVSQWKPGDTVEVVIEKKGEYTNFNIPKQTDKLEARVAKLESDLAMLKARLDVKGVPSDQQVAEQFGGEVVEDVPPEPGSYGPPPGTEISVDDIPW